MKKAIILIAVLAVICGGYVIWYKATKLNEEAVISPDFFVMFQTGDILRLFRKLNESYLLDAVFYNKELKDIYRVLMAIRFQLSQKKWGAVNVLNVPATIFLDQARQPVLVLNTGLRTPLFRVTPFVLKNIFSDSRQVSFSVIKEGKYRMYKAGLLSQRTSLYFCQLKNLLIVCLSRMQLEKVLAVYGSGENLLASENYLQVRSRLDPGALLRTYFNIEEYLDGARLAQPELYKMLQNLSLLQTAGASLEIDEKNIMIDAFVSSAVKDEITQKIIRQSAASTPLLNMLPDSSEGIFLFTFNEFRDVWEYLLHFLELTGQNDKKEGWKEQQKYMEKILNAPLEEVLFSWLNQEAAVCTFRSNISPALFLGVKSAAKAGAFFRRLEDKGILRNPVKETYGSAEITRIQLSALFQFIADIFAPDLKEAYFTIFNEYLILSREAETVKGIIDRIRQDRILMYNSRIQEIYRKAGRANLLLYRDLQAAPGMLLRGDNMLSRIMKDFHYSMMSVQFADNGLTARIMLSEQKLNEAKPVKNWPVSLEAASWGGMLVYDADSRDMDEIIAGTEDGKINVLDIFGDKSGNWPVRLEGELRTAPFLVAEKGQPAKIGAVSLNGRLYVWDRDGFIFPNFPIYLEGDFERTPLVQDINGDERPELVLVNGAGKVYAVDLAGRTLPGFPVQVNNSVRPRVEVLDMNRDGYYEILCSTGSSSGEMVFINSTGEIKQDQVLKTGYMTSTQPVIHSSGPGAFQIIQVTDDGHLFIWDRECRLMEPFPVFFNDTFNNPPVVGEMNQDQESEVLLFSSTGRLYGINFKGYIVLQAEMDCRPIRDEPIQALDIDNNRQKELVVPCTDNLIRFYRLDGTLLYSVRGSTAPVLADMDRDGHREAVTFCDEDNSIYLYRLP